MKVEKRGAENLLVPASGAGWFLRSAACGNATYDQSHSPFVSVFCLWAAVTRNRQIILFEWLFQSSRKASTTIGNLL